MSYNKVVENVPNLFIRRSGDWFAEGGNNTLLVLGTDRAKPNSPATGNDGLGNEQKTGTAMLIVGRDNQGGHPNLKNDAATLYLSMKTEADKNLSAPGVSADSQPAAILRSKNIRLNFGDAQDKGSVKIWVGDQSSKDFIIAEKGSCELHCGSNIIKMTVNNNQSTDITVKGSDTLQLGNLATALSQLVEILRNPLVSQIGNLGAPVPANPDVLDALKAWKDLYIDTNNNDFKEMNAIPVQTWVL